MERQKTPPLHRKNRADTSSNAPEQPKHATSGKHFAEKPAASPAGKENCASGGLKGQDRGKREGKGLKRISPRLYWRRTLLFSAMFVVGVIIFMYPIVSNMYNGQVQYTAISNYDSTLKTKSQEELDHQIKLCNNFNHLLATGRTSIPRDVTEGASKTTDSISKSDLPSIMEYAQVIGHIDVPAIDVHLPIYSGVDDYTLSQGAAWMTSTSAPVGGPSTHTAITGHRGLPSSDMFRHLDRLQDGDLFYVSVLGQKLAYRVNQIKKVDPSDISDLAIEPGKDLATLITCDPYMINSERMLVRGERVPLDEAPEPPVRMNFVEKHATDFTSIVVAFSIFGLVLLFLVWRDRKKTRHRSGV